MPARCFTQPSSGTTSPPRRPSAGLETPPFLIDTTLLEMGVSPFFSSKVAFLIDTKAPQKRIQGEGRRLLSRALQPQKRRGRRVNRLRTAKSGVLIASENKLEIGVNPFAFIKNAISNRGIPRAASLSRVNDASRNSLGRRACGGAKQAETPNRRASLRAPAQWRGE
jgi:hypothetical protein